MLRYSVIVYFALATALHAQTVYVNSHIRANWWSGAPPHVPPQITFGIWKDAHFPAQFPPLLSPCVDCVTAIGFEYDGATIKVETITLDEGSDWFLVQPGDRFSRATIDAGQFPTITSIRPPHGGEVTVGLGDFFLGVNTGKGIVGFPPIPSRTAFGWVHLRPVDGVLTMVENVMSYNSPGIIVGTTTVVPEPATWLLACLALCCVRRHR